MLISISFVLAVVLGMLIYIINDPARSKGATLNDVQNDAAAGAALFGANCSQCHGPKGEGGVGPALNRPEWRADNPNFDANGVYNVISAVLIKGQYSPQPGIQMPAWSRTNGGPFTDQQLDSVITFIETGDWNSTLSYTASPNYIADLPLNDAMKVKYPLYGKTDSADAKKQTDDANAELATIRKLLQTKGCINCHAFGSAGSTLGPNLTEVGSRRTADWLTTWIKDPSAVVGTNRGPNLLPWFTGDNRTAYWPMNPTFMPTIQMTDQERQTIVNYLKDLTHPQPKVTS
jgi:mono/diheme cytochrome c family protein